MTFNVSGLVTIVVGKAQTRSTNEVSCKIGYQG